MVVMLKTVMVRVSEVVVVGIVVRVSVVVVGSVMGVVMVRTVVGMVMRVSTIVSVVMGVSTIVGVVVVTIIMVCRLFAIIFSSEKISETPFHFGISGNTILTLVDGLGSSLGKLVLNLSGLSEGNKGASRDECEKDSLCAHR
jgi:hypothetical protein